MRLLTYNSKGVLKLVNFTSDNQPRYGILSHTWTEDEVLCHELQRSIETRRSSLEKVYWVGSKAAADGLKYFWVDTCCIDKSSSAEINETINSMFQWYQKAEKCYVYLEDISIKDIEDREDWEEKFRQSRWFTRAWTLPELIAPRVVEFFSRDGALLGDKSSLEPLIHEITGIPVAALRGHPAEFSISDRLSWAQNRQASREEDRVYSLLGICNVFMPIVYGEGYDHAFRRLQEEIRKGIPKSGNSSRTGMRLLVTRSDPLRLENVFVDRNLQYAILSHTWGNDEVTYEDMRSATAEQRGGYSKLRSCCNLAAQHGFDYAWIDTCCIDKSSSAELQEAICSMYMWYKNASICYVYLSDCRYDAMDSFSGCKWFTRGWTLQELIAPKLVEFYDQNWIEIGTKQSLCAQIAEITSIDPMVLRGADPTQRTVAERMSWAASRQTTRIEDIAYSLMGLFKVFMPMLYGEGHRAFIRLQEEIIKQTEDYTIFSWKARSILPLQRGLFAHSPAEFMTKGPDQITPRFVHQCNRSDTHLPPALTSRGLVLSLPIAPCTNRKLHFLAWVSCSTLKVNAGRYHQRILCLRLKEMQSTPQIFARISSDELESLPVHELKRFKLQTICVLPSNIDAEAALKQPENGRILIHPPDNDTDFNTLVAVDVAPWAIWTEETRSLNFPYTKKSRPLAAILFGPENEFLVTVGFDEDIPWCSLVTRKEAEVQGKSFDDPQSLHSLGVSTEFSDRVKKKISGHRLVTAALRASKSKNARWATFALHVDVVHLSDSIVLASRRASFVQAAITRAGSFASSSTT